MEGCQLRTGCPVGQGPEPSIRPQVAAGALELRRVRYSSGPAGAALATVGAMATSSFETSSTLTHLECSACGRKHDADRLHNLCPDCGKVLLARYDLARAARRFLVF